MYLEDNLMYAKLLEYTLMVDRHILKNTKVYECSFNAFGCIYYILHYNCSIFQCIYNIFEYVSMYFKCTRNIFMVYFDVFIVYFNVF
jgi:hypothetical protein